MHRLYEWLRRHPTTVDALTAVVLGSLTFLTSSRLLVGPAWVSVIAALGLFVAVIIRRRWSTAAYLTVIAAGLLQVLSRDGPALTPLHLAMPLMLYTVAATGSQWARRSSLIWILVAPELVVFRVVGADDIRFSTNSPQWLQVLILSCFYAAPLAVAWLWGDSTRSRRRYYRELTDRADRLELQRQALDRAAVAEERARIARELHDVVAHHVSVMVVQADGARYAMASAPEQAVEALTTISRTGREALTEMRHLLGILRSDLPLASGGTGTNPQPGIETIPELIEQVRTTGLPVDFAVHGRPQPVSAGLGLTAYRVVQESLTNALKHGGPAVTATVELTWRRGTVQLRITDTGTGPPDTAGAGTAGTAGTGALETLRGGHGIIGMRERVAGAGGTLQTGAGSTGGFRVSADLPLRPPNTPTPQEEPTPQEQPALQKESAPREEPIPQEEPTMMPQEEAR